MTFNSITREEYYLAKMAELYDGNTPKPILRAEYYLARACGDYDGDLPVPITRYDKYLARIAGENISVPNPILRIEHFLLAVIGDVGYKNLPIPITRKEKLLYEIVKSDDYTLVTKKGKGQIIATGTMDGVPFEQIIMQGWTKQETTTGAQLFNKSTVTENKYISYTNGGESIEPNFDTNASDYINVSGFDQIYVTKTNLSEWAAFYNSDKVFISGFNGYGKAIAVPEGANYVRFTVAKESMDTFMVNAGSAAQPWEPYTGGKPSPSPDYPQEIASAGLYDNGKYKINLTIADGSGKQQNVLLTSDRPLNKWDRLEKRDGVWGWGFNSNTVVLDGGEDEKWTTWNNGFYVNGGISMTMDDAIDICFCRELIYSKNSNGLYYRLTGTGDNKSPIIYGTGLEDVTQFRLWLQAHPLIFVYKSLNETLVPLPESEQLALNALATYYPTTVISNSQDCEMEVTYKTKHI